MRRLWLALGIVALPFSGCLYVWPAADDTSDAGDAGDASADANDALSNDVDGATVDARVCTTGNTSCKSDQDDAGGGTCCCKAGLPKPADFVCGAGKSRQNFNQDGCFDCLCIFDAAPPRIFQGTCTSLGGVMFDNNRDTCLESCWCGAKEAGAAPTCAHDLGESSREAGCYVTCN